MPEFDIRVHAVHILPLGSRLVAFVDLLVNNAILIKGLRIVEGKAGLFVSMPQEQGRDNRWYDMVRILNISYQQRITEIVIDAYRDKMNQIQKEHEDVRKQESDRICP